LPLFAFIRVYKVNAACGRESALGYSRFALDLALFFLIQSKPLSEPRMDANRRELNQNPEPKKAIFRGCVRLQFRACPTNGSDRGSLRSHDLTLFVSEKKDLEDAILREMDKFLLEMGAGFIFVARPKRFPALGLKAVDTFRFGSDIWLMVG